MLISIAVEQCSTEELAGKVAVLFILIFRKQFLISLAGWLEALDSLQHEGIDDILVIIPVEALLLEQSIEIIIVLNEGLVSTAPELAVVCIVVELLYMVLGHGTVNIAGIEIAGDDGSINLAHSFDILFPRRLLHISPVSEHLVLFQLHSKSIVCES